MLAHDGEGDYSTPRESARLLGDYLHPLRPVSPTHITNAASREVSADVAEWRWERVLSFYAGLEVEAEQSAHPDG